MRNKVFILALSCKSQLQDAIAYQCIQLKALRHDFMDGQTPQGQIWTVPVKKVNPKSLTGAHKSEREWPRFTICPRQPPLSL